MYVAAGVVAAVFLLLGILAGKESVDSRVGSLLRPFYRMALYLYKRICIRKVPFLSNLQVEKDLAKLHPGEHRNQLCTEYYVNKIAKSLMICLVGTFLGLVISVQSEESIMSGEPGSVTRGTYEEGATDVELVCVLPEGNQEFRISVGAKVFDEAEIKELYDSFVVELPSLIRGENSSLQDITQKLSLQESYEGYPFTVSWKSDNPDIIRGDGTVSAVEVMQQIRLQADIAYEGWEWEEYLSVQVIPPELTEEERVHLELEKILLASEEASRMESVWKLPGNWNERELLWERKAEDMGPLLCAGAMVVAFLVYLLADKDLHDEVEKRKRCMKRDYPDVVHKLTLYLGAGMTIRGTFQKMAEEYEQALAEGKERSPVYEEMLHACRELRTGVSEGAVYEHFGKRTGLQEYIRLSTLFAQNLKKGNSTLLQRLREEADKASTERIQYGKRLGEEAMTKLLLPMGMMLLVVMLMIMIPAFSSVGA